MAVKFECCGFMVSPAKGHKREGWGGKFTERWGPYVNRGLKGAK